MGTSINRQRILSRKLSGIQGTSSSTPVFSNSYSMNFDGATQELNHSGAIPILGASGLGDWTISFWFRAPTVAAGSNQRLIFFDGTGVNITWYFTNVGLLQGGLGVWTDSCSYSFSDNTWYNVVYVADRSNSLGAAQAKGYYWVNGVFNDAKNIASYAASAFPTTGSEIIMGNNSAATQSFEGEIDEISIWDRTLSDIEVADLYNGGTPTDLTGQADLTHWWRMGDPSGQASYPTISDLGSVPLDLTMINMVDTNIVTDVP